MDSNTNSFFEGQPIFILDHHTLDILDANEGATDLYGYSREELQTKNITDLGIQKKRTEVLGTSAEGSGIADRIWEHKTKQDETLYVQFTHHMFNYNGRPAKFAVAHDIRDQIEQGEPKAIKFPKFETTKKNYPVVEIGWDGQMRITKWSDKAEELFGWREDEVKGHNNFFEYLIPDEELPQAYQNLNEAVDNQKEHFSAEGKAYTKSGHTLFCKWNNSMSYNRQGDLDSIDSLITVVGGRKESENVFRTLAEKSLVGVYLIQDNNFKYVNPQFAEIFGYDRTEVESKKTADNLVHPDDRDFVMGNMRKRLEGKVVTQEYEFRGITKEGKTVNVQVYSSVITYLDKPAVVGTLLDVTETEEAIKKYRASVKSFEDLFDSISDAIYIQDSEGKFIKVNDAAVELNGYDRDFLLGNTPDVLAAPGKVDLDETWGYFKDALHGTTRRFEQWGLRKSGEVFPEEVVLNPGSYFGEDVVIAVSRDISVRYKAEQQLRESEEMFRQLFQNAPISIAFMDKHQEIREINTAFSETFGYKIDEVKGINIDKLIVPEDYKGKARTISEAVLEGRTVQDFGKRLRKDGSLIDVLIYGVPVRVNGKTIAIFGIYVDITDRKKAEEQVKKSLKEKEVLLAEIHHRVKNNLAVITGLLELQAYNTDSRDATEVLKSSQMRINSIALIHEKLYQNEDLSQISFDVYLEELTDVIISSLRSSETKVTINIDAEPIKLTISQAIPCGLILNELITNANKHAFPNQESGNIDISFSKEGNLIRLTVGDDGVGIPDDADLENPKSLGLKLIRTLSKQLSGRSSFSDNNPGTKFSLEFELEE